MCLFSFLCQSAPETAEEKQPDRPQPIKKQPICEKNAIFKERKTAIFYIFST
jgi:hypothetical protein